MKNLEDTLVLQPFDQCTLVIPNAQWLRKSKLDKQFAKFLEVFKKLHINILFVDALEHMPNHVKFMKDILANKWKLADYEIVA